MTSSHCLFWLLAICCYPSTFSAILFTFLFIVRTFTASHSVLGGIVCRKLEKETAFRAAETGFVGNETAFRDDERGFVVPETRFFFKNCHFLSK